MFNLKSLCLAAVVCSVSANAVAKHDDTMTPPKPLQNKVYNSLVGTWEGDSDKMGKKMHDVLKINWALNHQFLVLALESTNKENPKHQYKGMGMFGIDANGKAKTWWFDIWGADAVSVGTGNFERNKLVIKDGNTMFHEERSFEVKGSQMMMNAKGTVKMHGKEEAFDQAVTYTKAK